VFLLVPAYPGSPEQRAVKRLCVYAIKLMPRQVGNRNSKRFFVIADFGLFQQTLSYSLLYLLVMKYFWWGCFAPPPAALGGNCPSPYISYVSALCCCQCSGCGGGLCDSKRRGFDSRPFHFPWASCSHSCASFTKHSAAVNRVKAVETQWPLANYLLIQRVARVRLR